MVRLIDAMNIIQEAADELVHRFSRRIKEGETGLYRLEKASPTVRLA